MIWESSAGRSKIRPSFDKLRTNGFLEEHPEGEFPFVLSSLARQGVSKHEWAPAAASPMSQPGFQECSR
jgi:hypothetical protein